MSSVVTGVLNLTLGVLLEKARSETAKKLSGGDFTDEKCRQLIIRELDDIKAKIDGLARKDLVASANFLKEGLVLLNLLKDTPNEKTTTLKQPYLQLEGACAITVAEDGSALSFKTNENYIQAKESFKSSNMKATEAFSNEALAIEDRIMATKLCVVSRMLMSLENPDGGLQTCLHYLERLHGLPAIKETFSVYIRGGWKSKIKTAKRLEYIMLVSRINFSVYDFCLQFGGVKLLNWPTINIKGNVYNPVMADENVLDEMDFSLGGRLEAQTQDQASVYPPVSVVNSTGKVIVADPQMACKLFINKRHDKQKLFCSLPKKDGKAKGFCIVDLAVDGEDNVFILTIGGAADTCFYKLFAVDSSGQIKNCWRLNFVTEGSKPPMIAVGEDNKIVVAESKDVYVCNGSDCEAPDLKVESHFQSRCGVRELCISNKNEIILFRQGSPTAIYLYTMQGKKVNKFKISSGHNIKSFAFNHATNDILLYTTTKSSDEYLLRYSTTGDQLQTLDLASLGGCWTLKSHPSGPVVLLSQTKVLHLQ